MEEAEHSVVEEAQGLQWAVAGASAGVDDDVGCDEAEVPRMGSCSLHGSSSVECGGRSWGCADAVPASLALAAGHGGRLIGVALEEALLVHVNTRQAAEAAQVDTMLLQALPILGPTRFSHGRVPQPQSAGYERLRKL